MAQDEHGYLETLSFSWGIMHIFMAYVALIGRTIGEFRHTVDDSPVWNKTTERRREAEGAVWSGAWQAICIMLLMVIFFAILIPLLTNPLDQRMHLILEGISRLLAGVVQGLLSCRIAIWLDVYYWRVHRPWKVGTTVVELKHRIRWAVCKKILRMFFLLILLFQGADAVTIPVSIIAGVSAGAFVDFIIYKLRRVESDRCRKAGCITLVVLLVFWAVIQLANGVLFIAAVWDGQSDDVSETEWDVYALLIMCLLAPVLHIIAWQMGLRMKRQHIEEGLIHEEDHNSPESKLKRHRMVTSMFISVRKSSNDNLDAFGHMDEIAEGDEDQEEDSAQQPNTDLEKSAAKPEAPAEGEDVQNVEQPAGEKDAADNEAEDHVPTLWELMMDWQCCGCVRQDDMTCWQKTIKFFSWFLYICVCLLCCFNIFNNIGATQQQEHVRRKLPDVYNLLYRDMDSGPVCAFDNRGAESNITTFADKDAAHAAGFLVVHCGACGACSDWHNLRLEYTTRNFLASESRKCAQGSLFGGGYKALVECLEAPAIGFQGQCAICWADDIECTKKFCWQLGLQSFFINTLTDFAVTNNTITAAACEEAHCEAGNPGHFVSCSGATRRRMNVTSSIARPGAQRCNIVDVDWAELFPEGADL